MIDGNFNVTRKQSSPIHCPKTSTDSTLGMSAVKSLELILFKIHHYDNYGMT